MNDQFGEKVSPLKALYHYRNLLKENIPFSLSPLKKYFKISENMTDKQVIKMGLFSDRTIRTRIAEIKQINELLFKHSLPRIGSMVVAEKITYSG